MCCKCAPAWIIPAGAAGVDLCPKYAHVSGGQECGAPKLIVRISGGLCVVYTAQQSGNSSLVLTDCRSFHRAVGALQRQRRKSRSTNNTAHCHSDRQLTHSSTQRSVSELYNVAAGSTSSWPNLRVDGNVFYTHVGCNRPNSSSGLEIVLISLLDKSNSTVLHCKKS